MSHRPCLSIAVLIGSLALGVPIARAGDLITDIPPMKWIEPLLAEDLPDLTYPAYFDDFDKAQAQVSAGRYKLSLITLKQIKSLKPDRIADAAVLKARSLKAL